MNTDDIIEEEEEEVKYDMLTDEQFKLYQLLQSFGMSDESIHFFVGKYKMLSRNLFTF